MRLPAGVFERPRQKELIAKDEWAVIRIDTKLFPNNEAYTIERRNFEGNIAPYLHGDWEEFERYFGLKPYRVVTAQTREEQSTVLASRAEHGGNPRLPNITVVPNLLTEQWSEQGTPHTVLGCTMGQFRPAGATGQRIVEVYEFQTYGCLTLDRERQSVELWVAHEGDKVAVPSGCHTTLYNLGDKDNPLISLDFAEPDLEPAIDELARLYGPVLLGYYDDHEVVFTLNRLYLDNPRGAGVHLEHELRSQRERQVRIRRGGRLDLGRLLYEELTTNPETIGDFARLGVRIKKATSEEVVEPQGRRLYFSRPLVAATAAGTEVYRYFFPASAPLAAQAPILRRLAGGSIETTEEEEPRPGLLALNRRLVVVMEGAGEWVERAYRPLFERKVNEGRGLAIFYADDTRWKGRPRWADELHDWEVYLDKADPGDFARYWLLRPDVVFVVTPDFTHCAVARNWLGKSPLVLIEKPFDSQIKSVEDLLVDLADSLETTVLGLDHYQFYALSIARLKGRIEEHLGGALARVEFSLLEDKLVEVDRVRSLQHGLTLDLLPHLVALLTYFGDVGTIDDIQILDTGRYEPLNAKNRDTGKEEPIKDQFNETYSWVKFTFRDNSGNNFPVPCEAFVGKGCRQEVKYLEVVGHSGNAIRVDLREAPVPDPRPGYPWDSLFFLLDDRQPRAKSADEDCVRDPYDEDRPLYIRRTPRPKLERLRYDKLLDDLCDGTDSAIGGTLSLSDGLEVVRALDRIWRAVQDFTPWSTYSKGTSPVEAAGRPEAGLR